MSKAKYYVVWKGRRTGIFSTWDACSAQVTGYPDAEYKSFASFDAAQAAFAGVYEDHRGKPASANQWLFAPEKPVLPSLCVDAACSGSPGPVEYRGVETESGRQIFRKGPYQGGTNNIGEFLAIVHALKWLRENGKDWPVYTDSGTALAWLRNKKAKTNLSRSSGNAIIFEKILQTESWLKDNSYSNRVLKWDTRAWGEIPADFGRK
jgi:ribonuclease HI